MTNSRETPLKHSKWINFEKKKVLFISSLIKVNSLEYDSKPLTIIQRDTICFKLGEDIPKGKHNCSF